MDMLQMQADMEAMSWAVDCWAFPLNPPPRGSWGFYWYGFWHGFRWHNEHWKTCRTCHYYDGLE